MNEKAKRTRKAHIKRRKFDSMRSLRVVKHFDYPFVLENSFIEVTEGYIFSDRDTYDVFASFVFKNLSEKELKRLDIRIDFYFYQNIPYTSLDFCYSQDALIPVLVFNASDIDIRLILEVIYGMLTS